MRRDVFSVMKEKQIAGKEARQLVEVVGEDMEVQRGCLLLLSEEWSKDFG